MTRQNEMTSATPKDPVPANQSEAGAALAAPLPAGKESSVETAHDSCCGRGGRRSAGQDPVKRQQILDGAQRVFLRMGFDAASMNDITREAGVSKGTIYVYFNNKEDLFGELCDHYRKTVFSPLVERLDQGFASREELVDYGMALATLITSETAIQAQRIIVGISERKPELAARFYERGPRRGLFMLRDFVQMLVDRGIIVEIDALRAAQQLSDLFISGLYRTRLFGVMPEAPDAAVIRDNVEAAVDMFFRAYASDREKP